MAPPPKAQKQAETVAVSCHGWPRAAHGKEGVDGSSPSEAFTKGQQMAFFVASNGGRRPTRFRKPVPKACPKLLSKPTFWLEHRAAGAKSTSVGRRGSTASGAQGRVRRALPGP